MHLNLIVDIMRQDSMNAENRALLLDGAARMSNTIVSEDYLTGPMLMDLQPMAIGATHALAKSPLQRQKSQGPLRVTMRNTVARLAGRWEVVVWKMLFPVVL